MTSTIDVLLPVGERAGLQQSRMSPRLDGIKGKRIGILYNNWKAMEYITAEYSKLLVDEFGAKEAFGIATPSTLGMPEELIADVVKRCDATIVGLAT